MRSLHLHKSCQIPIVYNENIKLRIFLLQWLVYIPVYVRPSQFTVAVWIDHRPLAPFGIIEPTAIHLKINHLQIVELAYYV